MTPQRWQQIKAVLAAALERPALERVAFLDQACGDDELLRAEIESLMAYEQPDDSHLISPVTRHGNGQVTISTGSSASQPVTANLTNDHLAEDWRIGPYKIIRELGRGGMGAVYLAARADDQYRQQVAIKLIRPGRNTDFVLRRFRNERQILAALDHPHIAKLLDGGTTEDGLPYLVMEYVAGIPINEYCDQHALDIAVRLKLFQQVCAAVHYAHQRQVIHRDVKPGNILVAEEGGLKLLDFGIAKLLTPDLAAQTLDPTLPALRLMTPAYASPEQIKGEPITATTDVYSLGVLLYELLTGHKPYRVKSQAAHEMTQAVIEEEPLKPSSAITLTEEAQSSDGLSALTLTPESVSKIREGSPDRLRRRLQGDLDNIVLMALRKDPHRRYASVEQFSEDIRRHLAGLPVTARKDTLGYRTGKFIRRNRVGVAVSVLSMLLLVPSALLGYLWSSSNEQQTMSGAKPRSVAVLPFKVISAEAGDDYLGTGIADAIISALRNLRGVTVRPMRASLKYAGASQDPVEAGRALRADAILEGTISRVGENLRITAQLVRAEDGSRLWETKSADEIETLLRVQDFIPAQVAEALGLALTEEERRLVTKRHTASLEAYQLYLKGRHLFNQRTAKDAKQAIECFERAIKIDPAYALAYAGSAHTHILGTNPLAMFDRMQKAKAAAVKALELDHTLAEAHMALGRAIIYCDWDWVGSEKAFKRAIELNPNYAEAHYWYSHNSSALGRHDEAVAEIKRLQEIDPFAPRNTLQLGLIFYLARQYDQAIKELRKTPFEIDSAYYQLYWRLGLVYVQKGMYEEAISTFKKTETLSGEMPLAKASLAYAYAKSGNHSEARRILDELRGITQEIPFINLAAAHAYLGDKDQAFEWLERAYEQRDNRIIHIKVEPALDSLRSDPRFEDLLRRIGLAP